MAQAFPFRGGVGLVTGAGGGIGAALARELAARGCALALVDRDAEGLARTAAAAEAAGVAVSRHVLDLADGPALRALPEAVAARFGRLTLLVNNAGVALGGRFDAHHIDDVAWLLDVNLHAVVRLTHACLPLLLREEAAQIVNLSSLFGLIAPPGQVAYATSKFAVRGFSEALGHEYAGRGLGVTVVYPGGVATGIARSARGPRPTGDAAADAAARQAFEAGRDAFQSHLRLSPEEAAAAILRAVAARRPRVVIGRDARAAALVQRLLPAGYWRALERLSGGKV